MGAFLEQVCLSFGRHRGRKEKANMSPNSRGRAHAVVQLHGSQIMEADRRDSGVGIEAVPRISLSLPYGVTCRFYVCTFGSPTFPPTKIAPGMPL